MLPMSIVLPTDSVFNTIESTQKVCYNLELSKVILDSAILIRESLIDGCTSNEEIFQQSNLMKMGKP